MLKELAQEDLKINMQETKFHFHKPQNLSETSWDVPGQNSGQSWLKGLIKF